MYLGSPRGGDWYAAGSVHTKSVMGNNSAVFFFRGNTHKKAFFSGRTTKVRVPPPPIL